MIFNSFVITLVNNIFQEIQVSEPPQLITLIDSSLAGSSGGGIPDNHICVAYRHQFDLVNERTGEVSRLHAVEGSRAHLVAAVDLYEDEEPELLLCYNRKYPSKLLSELCWITVRLLQCIIYILHLSFVLDTCHFQKLSEESVSSTEFDFHWNSVPSVIGEH